MVEGDELLGIQHLLPIPLDVVGVAVVEKGLNVFLFHLEVELRQQLYHLIHVEGAIVVLVSRSKLAPALQAAADVAVPTLLRVSVDYSADGGMPTVT